MTIESIFIFLALGLTGLGAVLIVLFGIRSLSYGKQSPSTIAMFTLPFLILGILGLVMGDWAVAAIWTTVITFGLALAALAFTGLSSIFN